MRLLLFDIDGTLVDTGGIGRSSLQEGMRLAFPEAVGEQEVPPLELAGATDLGLTRFLFETFDVEQTIENETAFLDAYVGVLRDEIIAKDGTVRGRVLDGVNALLDRLTQLPDVAVGLLTGNTLEGAQTKMDAYGLSQYFCFESGAYGSDHWDRNELGFVAITRASEKRGHCFSSDQVTVIGDTPKDIACGKACGARTLAVAAGCFEHAAIAGHEPNQLVGDLAATEDIVSWLRR